MWQTLMETCLVPCKYLPQPHDLPLSLSAEPAQLALLQPNFVQIVYAGVLTLALYCEE